MFHFNISHKLFTPSSSILLSVIDSFVSQPVFFVYIVFSLVRSSSVIIVSNFSPSQKVTNSLLPSPIPDHSSLLFNVSIFVHFIFKPLKLRIFTPFSRLSSSALNALPPAPVFDILYLNNSFIHQYIFCVFFLLDPLT